MLEKPPIGDPCNGCGVCCKIVICSTGSYALGLVATYGERAAGPCPALTPAEGEAFICGLIHTPKDWLPQNPRGPTVLREALKIMIGAGAGCDEAGDEPDETARPKQERLAREYLERQTPAKIRKAVETVFPPARR